MISVIIILKLKDGVDFKMRMRRKPWARPELEACDFFVANGKKESKVNGKILLKIQKTQSVELGVEKEHLWLYMVLTIQT